MIQDYMLKLFNVPEVKTCPARPSELIRHDLTQAKIHLPEAHVELLSLSNGLMAYSGYFRLFGVGCGNCESMDYWNDRDTWKFAWQSRVETFLCFGETAWGDQYAYNISDRLSPVYFLSALRMEPEIIAPTFEKFLEDEFLRCAIQPYDERIVNVRTRIGELNWGTHIVYQPSPLLGGEMANEDVIDMPSRAAMILNGDLLTQCRDVSVDRNIKQLEAYLDGKGRPRVRVHWN